MSNVLKEYVQYLLVKCSVNPDLDVVLCNVSNIHFPPMLDRNLVNRLRWQQVFYRFLTKEFLKKKLENQSVIRDSKRIVPTFEDLHWFMRSMY